METLSEMEKAIKLVSEFGGKIFFENYDEIVIMGAKLITYDNEPMIVLKSKYNNGEFFLGIYCENGEKFAVVNKALYNPEILDDQIAIREDESKIIDCLVKFDVIKKTDKKVQYGYIKANVFDVKI